MKKVLIIFASLMFVIALLNLKVTTRQGIDHVVSVNKIPLYLKAIDFYDRHLNYKWLSEKIIDHKMPDAEKALTILKWTFNNIQPQPKGLRVVDDHVWHIIVRGYGNDDQFQDVFCTLCNYAGLEAFFDNVRLENGGRIPLSFVKLKRGWSVFDAANGAYFLNEKNEIADVSELESGNWKRSSVGNKPVDIDYGRLFKNLSTVSYGDSNLKRSGIQSPMRRIFFGLKHAI